MSAAHYRLDNLIGIVDANGMGLDGDVADIMNIEPIAAKFEAFGWSVEEIDGHDMAAVVAAFTGLALNELGSGAARVNLLSIPLGAMMAWNLLVYLVLAASMVVRLVRRGRAGPGPARCAVTRLAHAVFTRGLPGLPGRSGRGRGGFAHAFRVCAAIIWRTLSISPSATLQASTLKRPSAIACLISATRPESIIGTLASAASTSCMRAESEDNSTVSPAAPAAAGALPFDGRGRASLLGSPPTEPIALSIFTALSNSSIDLRCSYRQRPGKLERKIAPACVYAGFFAVRQ